MPEKFNSDLNSSNGGFIHGLVLRIKLVFRLLQDAQVSPFLKIIPLGSFLYGLIPINIPGPVDELFVLALGLYLFVELCPPQVVEEHMINIKNPTLERMRRPPDLDSIIDAEYQEIHEQVDGTGNKENKAK
jgi:hypothetical protein